MSGILNYKMDSVKIVDLQTLPRNNLMLTEGFHFLTETGVHYLLTGPGSYDEGLMFIDDDY
jgi:hypothetical protein